MTSNRAAFARAVRDETRLLLTRPWDAFVAFGLPLILLVVIAAMFAPGVIRQSPAAVVDHDRSSFTRAAVRNMQASSGLDVAYAPATLDEAMALMRQGKIFSFAYFPSGFTAGAFRQPEQATVYFNGAFQTAGALTALNQSAAIASAAAPALEERARQMGVPATALSPPDVQVSIIGNPQLNFELFLGGLLGPGVLHLLAACSAVLAVGRLMQGKSFRPFKIAHGGRTTAALAGHLTPHFLIFTLWGLAWIVWLCGFRGWGVAGSLPLLMLGMAALMAVSVALSALLVAVAGDNDLAFSATAIYSGAAIAFSNGTLPLDHGPRFAQFWSDVLPYTHYLRLQTSQMVTDGAKPAAVHDLLILCAVTLGAFVIAALAIRWRANREPKVEALTFPLPTDSVTGSFAATFVGIVKARPVASLLLLAVVLYAFYYPAAYSGQSATGLPLAVVTSSQTATTRTLVEDLNASHAIEVAAVASSVEEAQNLMKRGVVDGIIVLPDGFETSLARGAPDGVAIYLNGGYLVRVTAIGKAAAGAVADVIRKRLNGLPEVARAASLTPSLKQVSLFNPTEGYGDYAVPAVSIVILQQTLLLGAGVIAAIRRETAAPVLRLRSRLGLWLALTVIGALSSLFYFGFVFWVQDYPRAGDLIGVILLAPLFSAAVSALGLCLGGLFDRHERVLQVLVGTSAPLFFLGGTAWPHFMMPQPLVWLANLFPSTAGVQAFVKMNSTGASLSEVAPEATVLVVLVVIYGLWLLAPDLRTIRQRQVTAQQTSS
ncbi:ABC transporter permease [Brevundimonas nasdae]|uniref:ABC transporter permease n=1 Tax=Brevundimonas nasdae TaxID=172043 RepID=A0ABX8TIR8_9CAUL|nr:ABC transporter permease [Brevundimonas nasdae]QYC11061.1 ABC transporter permease [Brevundimonas nasdae]QYC13848.1 ABC transporter permease [Brevundimonas nasdae]